MNTKYNKCKRGVFFMVLLIGLVACEEKIELDLDETYTRLVVEGELTTESKVHRISLTKSSGYFNNQIAPVVSKAKVSISDNHGHVYILNEYPKESGKYYTANDFKAEIGYTYFLKIEDVDINLDGKKEIYQASDVVRPLIPLDSISFEYVNMSMRGMTRKGYIVKGWGQENAAAGDFYIWKYYKNSVLQTDTLTEYAFASDELVNGNYISGMPMFFANAQMGDTITVEERSVSKEYYDFLNGFLMETTMMGGGGFGGPPANIKSNISNGALGWFNVSNVARTVAVIKNSNTVTQ